MGEDERPVSVVRSAVKRFLHKLLGDYGCYKIFALELESCEAIPELEPPCRFVELEESELRDAGDALIRDQAWYGGSQSRGFGIYRGDRLICVQWFWYGKRYESRNFWPLEQGEAKSVQLVTIPSEQGKGVAVKLKQLSANRMKRDGFRRLFSRVWCSHSASIRVNEKAGWKHVATVIEVYPLGSSRPWRIGGLEWIRRIRRKLAAS